MAAKKKSVGTVAAVTTESGTTDTNPVVATASAGVLGYIQRCTALLTQIEAAIPPGDALTSTDKKRQAKARKGGERYIPQLVALAQQYGVSLKLVPTETIEQSSAEAQALAPLIKQIGRVSKQLNDRVFQTQATSWTGSTKLYAILRRLGKDNGDLAAGLAPVEEFFNHRHPSVAKNHPKTKKGKAALAEQKALEQQSAALPAASATAEAPVEAPVAPVAASPPVAVNGAGGANGATTHA